MSLTRLSLLYENIKYANNIEIRFFWDGILCFLPKGHVKKQWSCMNVLMHLLCFQSILN